MASSCARSLTWFVNLLIRIENWRHTSIRKMRPKKKSVEVGSAAPIIRLIATRRSCRTVSAMRPAPVRSQSHEYSSRSLRLLTSSRMTPKMKTAIRMAMIFWRMSMSFSSLLPRGVRDRVFPEPGQQQGQEHFEDVIERLERVPVHGFARRTGIHGHRRFPDRESQHEPEKPDSHQPEERRPVVAPAEEPRAERHVGRAGLDHAEQLADPLRVVLAVAVDLDHVAVIVADRELVPRLEGDPVAHIERMGQHARPGLFCQPRRAVMRPVVDDGDVHIRIEPRDRSNDPRYGKRFVERGYDDERVLIHGLCASGGSSARRLPLYRFCFFAA